MIIDHDTMTEIGPTDETMPLRVVTQEEVKPLPFSERQEHVERMVKRWEYRHQFAGPFPVRRVQTLGGRLSISNPRMQDIPRDEKPAGVDLEKFAREAPIEDVVEAVKILSSDDTSTHALPAVEKLTGEPAADKLPHRSAAHVQRVFNEAGWPIAVWYGEATKSYWVMDEAGLHEFDSVTRMYQGMGWEAL